MLLLAAELIALIALFAADDAVHDRPPAATWGTSLRVIGAAFGALVAATLLQGALRNDIL